MTDPLGLPAPQRLPNGRSDNVRLTELPNDQRLQQVRDILEELRRRLGKNMRNSEELHYLERLLQQILI